MTTLRELKQGCLLHVLFALWLLGKPSTKTEIADEFGGSDEAVLTACRVLARPEHNLVIGLPNGRWPRWVLTPNGRRFVLGPAAAMDRQVSMNPLPADSALQTPTTTTVYSINPPPVDNSPVDQLSPLPADSDGGLSFPDATARHLCKLGGVTYDEALKSVRLALAEGDTEDDIRGQIEQWSGWIALHAPEAVGVMGASIARNIRSGDLCLAAGQDFADRAAAVAVLP